ncbi:MAG TPA: FeoB-associated Cys-rich membrane protein [Candidatus Avoscillospira stercoripullorum]|uniref:FeoB-associated Cys-rich membrane protein n=1 Tax=Candidatus Avoscillospira stercoripullorum TaxID=2840709 RepID=A0A9D1A8R3_9FIRM|nr:FeoB-associated Cys-rich membrane protein [Candidatus Avoscillospira stercoripullorum]
MNLATILVLLVIVAAVFAAVRYIRRHPSGCCGDCSQCAGHCPRRK